MVIRPCPLAKSGDLGFPVKYRCAYSAFCFVIKVRPVIFVFHNIGLLCVIGSHHLRRLETPAVCGWFTNLCPVYHVIKRMKSAGLHFPYLNAPRYDRKRRRPHLVYLTRAGGTGTVKKRVFRAHLSGASSQDNHFRADNRKTGKHPQGARKTGKERVLHFPECA